MKLKSRSARPRILIAGLGNLILTDDGVGIHAIRRLGGGLPRGVRAAEVGTAVLDALHLLEWADRVIAVDAMQAGHEPGSVYLVDGAEAGTPGAKASLHEVSLLSVLPFLRGRKPAVLVAGMEPAAIGFGLELSPAVEEGMPWLLAQVRRAALLWTDEPALSAGELALRLAGEAAPAGDSVDYAHGSRAGTYSLRGGGDDAAAAIP